MVKSKLKGCTKRDLPSRQTSFKWSMQTKLLAIPKYVIAKYDYDYYHSFDTEVTKGKPSPNEEKPSKGAPASARVTELARPKYINKKYVAPTEPEPAAKPGSPASARVVELAEPAKLALYHFRESDGQILEKKRLDKIDEKLKSSSAKVPPDIQEKIDNIGKRSTKGITNKQAKEQRKSVKRLSKPRPVRKPRPSRRRPRRRLSYIMKKINKSLYPKPSPLIKPDYDAPFKTKKKALEFEVTDHPRIAEMAAPKRYANLEPLVSLGGVMPSAMKYIASPNILRLATPKAQPKITELDVKENPFGVSRNAMKYRATKRIIDLAQPKDHTDVNTKANAFGVEGNALVYVASSRIIELAEPRKPQK